MKKQKNNTHNLCVVNVSEVTTVLYNSRGAFQLLSFKKIIYMTLKHTLCRYKSVQTIKKSLQSCKSGPLHVSASFESTERQYCECSF